MTYATDAELGMMDAFVEGGMSLNVADCANLLRETRRLRKLLALAWHIIEPGMDTRRGGPLTREYDRLWLDCIELGIVTLTPAQLARCRQMPFEPYASAVRIYEARNTRR